MSKKKTLYIAYGSNLNIRQMKYRCPEAAVVGTSVINDYKLVFRSVATIEPQSGESVPVAIWEISTRDESNLDIYEGFPHLYYKDYMDVVVNGELKKAMVYIMTDGIRNEIEPSDTYMNTIAEGYKTFGFDENKLRVLAGREPINPENIITAIRHKYNLTQKAMSKITGIPKRTIEAWDMGTRKPPVWLPKLIDAYLEKWDIEK